MNRVNTYPTEKHTVYVDEENNSRLMLSDSGALEYIGAPSGNGGKKSSGVAVSSFLGYENYGGNYTFHELTAAAASLLGSLKKIALGLMGGDAKPGLISVSGGETELELVFAYFYDNYRITGLDATVKMKFSGGRLTALELVPAEITVGKLCVSIPQRWAAARLYADLSRDEKSDEEVLTAEFVPVYKYVSNSKIAPVWAILTDGQKAGNPAD